MEETNDGTNEEEGVSKEQVVRDPEELMAELLVASKLNDLAKAKEILANENLVPQRKISSTGILQWGPLLWAVNKGYREMSTLLLQQGFADPFMDAVLERNKALQDSGDTSTVIGVSTPLHWAAFKGRLIILTELIEVYRFDVCGRDERGNTPLHLAASGAPRGNQKAPQFLKTIEILLSEGADIHSKNFYGNTALDVATNLDVRYLVKKVELARRTVDTNDDVLEDAMAGLDLLSIPKMREAQTNLVSLTDEVKKNMSTELLTQFRKAVTDAERAFVDVSLVNVSSEILSQLEAKKRVENKMELVNSLRPLQKSSDSLPLKNAVEAAMEKGVSQSNLESATVLISSVTAEIKLFVINNSCKSIACATSTDIGQRNSLENAIKRARLLECDSQIIAAAEHTLKRLDAEIELQACLSMTFKLSEAEKEGKHETTQLVLTLEPQVARIEKAINMSNIGGVNEALIDNVSAKLQTLKVEVEKAKVADATRLKEEEEALLKAAKKKGKKKKKR